MIQAPDTLASDGQAKTLQAPKSFWASRTMIGIFAVMLSQVLKHYNINILPGDLGDALNDTMDYGGAMLAIYGRIKATQPITGTAHAAETVQIRQAIAVDPVLEAKIEAARRMPNFKG